MLLDALLRLRRAPKSVRDRYAFFSAVGFTAIVALVWAVTLPGRLEQTPGSLVEKEAGGTPFASLFSEVRNQFATAFQAVDEAPGTTEGGSPDTNESAPSVETSPTSITLTPEEAAAAAAQAANYVPPSSSTTPTPQVVQIITTSQLASSSATGSSPQLR